MTGGGFADWDFLHPGFPLRPRTRAALNPCKYNGGLCCVFGDDYVSHWNEILDVNDPDYPRLEEREQALVKKLGKMIKYRS